jgi:hypothetical protein
MFVTFDEFKSRGTLRISSSRTGFMPVDPDAYLVTIYVMPTKRKRG